VALANYDDHRVRDEPLLTDAGPVVASIDELAPDGGDVLVLAGSGPGVALAQHVGRSSELNVLVVDDVAALAVEDLVARSAALNPSLVVGIGGGRVIERLKLVAQVVAVPSVAVPTSLSQDGLCAPTAVITSDGVRPQRFECDPPTQVVPASHLIELAPRELSVACIADLVSNLSAIEDCDLAYRNGMGRPPTEALSLARRAAVNAGSSAPDAPPSELLASVLDSGRAMALSGDSRPCSGAEHKIAHAITEITNRPALHGLVVGVTTAFVARLRSPARLEEIENYHRRHDIAGHPDAIGCTDDEFVEAVARAQHSRRNRFTILDIAKPTASTVRSILRSRELAR